MARFIQIDYPAQHGGVTRITRGLQALGSYHLGHTILHALALVGSPVTAVAAKVRAGFAALAAARKQRLADEQLWRIALTDARVMADLSRAMSRDALRDTRAYL